MKREKSIILAFIFVVIAGAALYAPAVEAQQYTVVRSDSRSGTWEFSLPIIYTDSATIKGQGGSSADLHEGLGTGFGIGYNINDHFQINGLFSWSSQNYNATYVQSNGMARNYSGHLDSSTTALNGVFYLLKGNLTPYISGGIGMTYIDTNVQNGQNQTTCWWDPWYGYVCSSYTPTKTEYDVSYHAGVGLRWDINERFALQGSYNKTWIDIHKAQGVPDLDVYRIEIIFRM